MSTKNSGGNGSSGELPDRQASSMKSGNLHIQMLERGGDELKSDMNTCLNLCLVCHYILNNTNCLFFEICEYASIYLVCYRFIDFIWFLCFIWLGVVNSNARIR